MPQVQSRRNILKGGLALAGLGALGLPEWVLPALAQGETPVPFTDIPANANFTPAADRRTLDIRKIEGPFTPKDQFFTTQHYGHPDVDPATFRLKISGLVDTPKSLSLDDLKKIGNTELIAGFECSGNRRPLQGLSGNGRWTGVSLKSVLDSSRLKPSAREIVFYGADHGSEDVEFRTQKYTLEYNFGRSLAREKALSGEPFLAWALNGEPLTKHQGAPLRLIVPGWYGVANVKWLSQIHVQETRFVGHYQARWYLTLRSEMVGGQEVWKETEVSRMRPKSVISRVMKSGNRHVIHGFALNDGSALKSVEAKIDEGPWAAATFDKSNTQFGWKLFSYVWEGATPGEHTLVSRATDANGIVQPTQAELTATKKTFLEDNSQFPRKVMIA